MVLWLRYAPVAGMRKPVIVHGGDPSSFQIR